MTTETIDNQRQYILFLEKKISTLIDRLSDIQMDYLDTHNRQEDLQNQVDILEQEVYELEREKNAKKTQTSP